MTKKELTEAIKNFDNNDEIIVVGLGQCFTICKVSNDEYPQGNVIELYIEKS